MNTNRQTAVTQESKTGITAARLIRWSGLAAMVGGIIFAGIQPIHPPDVLASVTTSAWAIITPIKTAMAFLFLLGITGIYARQVKESGRLGLAGFLLLSLCWALELAFIFAEAFILPVLATAAPEFVSGYLGVVNGFPTTFNLGAIPALYGVGVSVGYILGGLVFGIATFRARILPRWAAVLLAAASVLTPLAALLPHDIQRLAGMPVGLAFAWLGYALWTERRAQAAESAPSTGSPQRLQTAAE